MKRLAVILLCPLVLFGQASPDGDWLPVPDGYVWPALAQDAKEFEPVRKAVSGLSAPVKAQFEGGPIPEQVEMFEADLNADGSPELFIEIPHAGGTGGTVYEIMSPAKEGAYRSVGSLLGWGLRFRTRKNGWYQIEVASRSGGGNLTRYLLTYEGGQYRTSRNEGHDFNSGKVTVRETQKE